MLAGNGVVAYTEQGSYFDKVEALRIGISFAAGVLAPNAQFEGHPRNYEHLGQHPDNAMVALFDADTVATDRTQPMLESIGPDQAAICGFGTRDDLGFLLAPVDQVLRAIQQIPPGAFRGYGPEDATLRIAVWSQRRTPFVLVPARWARIAHGSDRRIKHFGIGMKTSIPANRKSQHAIMRRLVAPEDIERCRADALQWPKRLGDYGRPT